MSDKTTRRSAVAGRSHSPEIPSSGAQAANSLNVMSTRGLGWLRSGSERLAPMPMALRPYVGPENRSQFVSPPKSRVRVVRGGNQ